MTLKEAIRVAETRSRNINLNWFVCKWNDVYIIHCTAYMLRHPTIKYVYSTGDLNKTWSISFDENTKKFKHSINILNCQKKLLNYN